jgi:TonB family protein
MQPNTTFFLEELRVLNPRTGATAASFPPKRDPLADAGPLSDGAGPAGRSRSVPGVDGAEAQGSDPAADLGGVFRVGSGVTAPVPLYMPEPEYSEEARAAKYQGTVVLYAEVDANGRPHNLKVMRSLGLGLDEKAVEAAVKWKFRPGYKNGKPVTVATTIEVNFRLF